MRIVLWTASFGGLALLLRAIVIGPPPMWIAIAALIAYTILSAAGWVFPAWQMYGDVFCSGGRERHCVALTFDDGPNPKTTPKVLDVLSDFGCQATFCVIGAKVDRHPELTRRIVREGHTLAMHGYDHQRLYALRSPQHIAADIEKSRKLITTVTGVEPKWFRPPIGHVSPRVVSGARRARVRLLGFSARGFDGLAAAKPESVRRRLGRRLRPGAIIALHDSAERDDFVPAGVDVLADVLNLLDARGLQVVPLDTLWKEALAGGHAAER